MTTEEKRYVEVVIEMNDIQKNIELLSDKYNVILNSVAAIEVINKQLTDNLNELTELRHHHAVLVDEFKTLIGKVSFETVRDNPIH